MCLLVCWGKGEMCYIKKVFIIRAGWYNQSYLSWKWKWQHPKCAATKLRVSVITTVNSWLLKHQHVQRVSLTAEMFIEPTFGVKAVFYLLHPLFSQPFGGFCSTDRRLLSVVLFHHLCFTAKLKSKAEGSFTRGLFLLHHFIQQFYGSIVSAINST